MWYVQLAAVWHWCLPYIFIYLYTFIVSGQSICPLVSLSDLAPGNQMEGLVCFFLSLSFCKGSIEGNNFENLCLMFCVFMVYFIYLDIFCRFDLSKGLHIC